jgi:maltooligosyltrehalose trehalohydrolase
MAPQPLVPAAARSRLSEQSLHIVAILTRSGSEETHWFPRCRFGSRISPGCLPDVLCHCGGGTLFAYTPLAFAWALSRQWRWWMQPDFTGYAAKISRPMRRLPVGAEPQPGGGVHFRVWAPEHRRVSLLLERPQESKAQIEFVLEREEGGYFAGYILKAGGGDWYRYRLDGEEQLYADPASRFQPDGPLGPSEVIDPGSFEWTDRAWPGVSLEQQVLYEMHVGTFTQEGTWEAATAELSELADLGITLVEIMPVADFAGRFGWGYDGVNLSAPTRLYGTPDDMRRFVDRAHTLGLGVALDVVYNHVGPVGNCLKPFSRHYVSHRYTTEWGEAINFDDENSAPVREFFLANVSHWIEEYHLDGLRFDATQNIYDASSEHILAAMCRRAREAARGRSTVLIAENEPQQVRLLRPAEQGGFGFDAVWNDDFHHSAIVALSSHNEGYYREHRGEPQEFVSAAKHGYLYQGQWYAWQKKTRGTPTLDVKPASFVNCLDNHDQVANSLRGQRCHEFSSPGCYRAMTALLLLMPGTPLLFQGQEFAASSPFLYFADNQGEVGRKVNQGRKDFLKQFRSLATPEAQAAMTDPGDPATFHRSKLNPLERQAHAEATALHRDLLRLRHTDPVFRAQRPGGLDGAVLGPEAFVLRYFGQHGDDRLLLVNFGRDLHLASAPEPLLAPPEGQSWQLLWSSEHPSYGGNGTAPIYSEENWRLPGRAAVVLAAETVGSQRHEESDPEDAVG